MMNVGVNIALFAGLFAALIACLEAGRCLLATAGDTGGRAAAVRYLAE